MPPLVHYAMRMPGVLVSLTFDTVAGELHLDAHTIDMGGRVTQTEHETIKGVTIAMAPTRAAEPE